MDEDRPCRIDLAPPSSTGLAEHLGRGIFRSWDGSSFYFIHLSYGRLVVERWDHYDPKNYSVWWD